VHLQGLIWGVNSYDQFGVELGKRLVGQGALGQRTTAGVAAWLGSGSAPAGRVMTAESAKAIAAQHAHSVKPVLDYLRDK
jgi:hypothetical protein